MSAVPARVADAGSVVAEAVSVAALVTRHLVTMGACKIQCRVSTAACGETRNVDQRGWSKTADCYKLLTCPPFLALAPLIVAQAVNTFHVAHFCKYSWQRITMCAKHRATRNIVKQGFVYHLCEMENISTRNKSFTRSWSFQRNSLPHVPLTQYLLCILPNTRYFFVGCNISSATM